MDISLGLLRVQLTPIKATSLSLTTAFKLHGFADEKLNKAHKIYSWDCETQTGIPPIQRPNILMRTQFEVPNRAESYPFPGMSYDIDTNAQWVAGAGFDTPAELVAETQTKFPPMKVPVNWDKLWKPIKDQYSFDLYVVVHFLVFLGRPAGMHELDYMFLAVPQMATFSTIITGRCTGVLPNGIATTSDAGTPEPDEIGESITDLYEAHEREIREFEAVKERLGGEIPGFPSPEDLEGF